MKNLNTKAWIALAVLAMVMALLLFIPAGTVCYWQAWIYLTIFFGEAVRITLYLMRKDPALLERRMSGGPTAEKRPTQKFIMLWVSIGFIALLVVSALDYRFAWSRVPLAGVVVGDGLVAVGFVFIFFVYKETHSLRRRSSMPPGRSLFRPGRTPSCAIRRTPVLRSISSAPRWRSARMGLRSACAHVALCNLAAL